MGHIFFIMGVSGSGKGTLINSLKKSSINNLHIPLSYKTRKIRKNETNGVDSHFISKQEFYRGIQDGEFIEYGVPYDGDEYYGTKYEDVIDNGIEKGKNVIKEIEINGLKRLRKEKPNLDDSYTTIFLNIPSDSLKQRIEERGALMSDEEFNRRKIAANREEIEAEKLCDYMINATKSKKDVLEDVLKIINEKIG